MVALSVWEKPANRYNRFRPGNFQNAIGLEYGFGEYAGSLEKCPLPARPLPRQTAFALRMGLLSRRNRCHFAYEIAL